MTLYAHGRIAGKVAFGSLHPVLKKIDETRPRQNGSGALTLDFCSYSSSRPVRVAQGWRFVAQALRWFEVSGRQTFPHQELHTIDSEKVVKEVDSPHGWIFLGATGDYTGVQKQKNESSSWVKEGDPSPGDRFRNSFVICRCFPLLYIEIPLDHSFFWGHPQWTSLPAILLKLDVHCLRELFGGVLVEMTSKS